MDERERSDILKRLAVVRPVMRRKSRGRRHCRQDLRTNHVAELLDLSTDLGEDTAVARGRLGCSILDGERRSRARRGREIDQVGHLPRGRRSIEVVADGHGGGLGHGAAEDVRQRVSDVDRAAAANEVMLSLDTHRRFPLEERIRPVGGLGATVDRLDLSDPLPELVNLCGTVVVRSVMSMRLLIMSASMVGNVTIITTVLMPMTGLTITTRKILITKMLTIATTRILVTAMITVTGRGVRSLPEEEVEDAVAQVTGLAHGKLDLGLVDDGGAG